MKPGVKRVEIYLSRDSQEDAALIALWDQLSSEGRGRAQAAFRSALVSSLLHDAGQNPAPLRAKAKMPRGRWTPSVEDIAGTQMIPPAPAVGSKAKDNSQPQRDATPGLARPAPEQQPEREAATAPPQPAPQAPLRPLAPAMEPRAVMPSVLRPPAPVMQPAPLHPRPAVRPVATPETGAEELAQPAPHPLEDAATPAAPAAQEYRDADPANPSAPAEAPPRPRKKSPFAGLMPLS